MGQVKSCYDPLYVPCRHSIKAILTMVHIPSTSNGKMKLLVGHWELPEVKLFFSLDQHHIALPKSGPVPELLKAAQSPLDTQSQEMLSTIFANGDFRYVGILGAILAWMQQKPSRETHSSSDPKNLPWYRIATNLSSVLATYVDSAVACSKLRSRIALCYRKLERIKGAAANTAAGSLDRSSP